MFVRFGHNDAVDQNTRDSDMMRAGRFVEQTFHLGQDDAAEIMYRLCDR